MRARARQPFSVAAMALAAAILGTGITAGSAAFAQTHDQTPQAPAAPAPNGGQTPAGEADMAMPAYDTAVLKGLNKITARTHPITARLDAPVRFGTLEIIVRACHKARPEDPPRTVAFLEIREYPIGRELEYVPDPIFAGWMLASSPGLNALEHPVYDVWLTDCRMSSGEASGDSE